MLAYRGLPAAIRAPRRALSWNRGLLAGAMILSCIIAGSQTVSVSGASRGPRVRMGSGIVAARLMIEPQDGVRPLIRAIDRAQGSIFVETYILTDQRVIRALERASAQGVAVYVLLERQPLGMGRQPQRVADLLQAAGIFVRWSPPWFRFTHAKFLVLDDRLAIISTANLSRSGFERNREVLLFDNQPRDVHEISALFRADWDRIHSRLTSGEPNVVVSPDDARSKIAELVRSARRQIDVYAEEVADREIEQLLVRMRRRGVVVRVILPWSARSGDARRLARSGVGVRFLVQPYAHAKVITVDAREAFAGSENLSSTSLDRNREIGVLLRGSALARLDALFESDWRRARSLG